MQFKNTIFIVLILHVSFFIIVQRHNKASFEESLTRLQSKVARIQEKQTKPKHESETNQNKTKVVGSSH